MGQRNIHMNELDHGQDSIHPEPCLVYSSTTNLSQSNIHSGRTSNFDLHQIPDHHETAFVYGVAPPYHQYPPTNLNLAIGSSSNHYPPFMAPPHVVNHGTNDPRMVGGTPADAYIRNNPYVDGAFKLKNSEGHPWNFHHYALAGSSSSRPLESDATLTDSLPFVHTDYGANDTSSIIEGGNHTSIRNGPGVLAHNPNHLVHGNYVGHPFILPANPWLGLQLGNNNGEINGGGRWNQPSTLPYLPGSMNGSGMEVGNMGIQGYQVGPQGHRPMHLPPMHVQGVRGQNMNFTSQVPTSSRRFHTNSPNLNSFQGFPETGPRYISPVPTSGFRLYRPHRRESSTQEVNNRHRNVPHLRVLPEDGVAIMDFAGFHESGHFMDQHRDMRMDIDQMSYEELLALGEQIGSVGSGLTEEAIARNLKTRLFAVSVTCSSSINDAPPPDHNLDFCVVCQTDYKHKERIAILECGHEYHADCLKKWLVVKNTCPICKSSALTL